MVSSKTIQLSREHVGIFLCPTTPGWPVILKPGDLVLGIVHESLSLEVTVPSDVEANAWKLYFLAQSEVRVVTLFYERNIV